jgi:hypothetical protein
MKTNLALVAVAAAVGITAMGCASKTDSPSTLHITGTVGQQSSALSGPRAVATSSDGRSFSAVLTKTGQFALDVPVGSTYRIVIANATRTGQLRVVGHLVNPTTHGTTDVIAVNGAGSLALGTLRPVGTLPMPAGAVHTMSVESKDGAEQNDGTESKDGGESKESDDDGKLCQDGDDVELDAEHKPGPELEASRDSAKPKESGKSCDVHDTKHDGNDD